MAKFSMKVMGKEVGPASLYAPPHDMKGNAGVDISSTGYGKTAKTNPIDQLNMSVGNNHSAQYPAPKTSGIKMRGTGAATKGVMSRGPMA
jgi:hypothetical protein